MITDIFAANQARYSNYKVVVAVLIIFGKIRLDDIHFGIGVSVLVPIQGYWLASNSKGWSKLVRAIITITSHERHVVSHHRPFNCLFNSLCGPTSKKHQRPCYGPFVRGIHQCVDLFGEKLYVHQFSTTRWCFHNDLNFPYSQYNVYKEYGPICPGIFQSQHHNG